MVFQHGLCADASQAAEVFPDGFRRLTLDFRGHGGSEAGDPAAFSLATFAGDLEAFIEATALGPLVIGGISMGAAVAMRLAVRRPDLVKALVLARPAWIAEPAPPNLRPNALVGDLLARFDPSEARANFDASPLAATLAATAPHNVATLRQFFVRQPAATTAALLSRIARDGPGVARGDLAALRVPTLVLGQPRDAAHPLALARELAGLIPGARLIQLAAKADDKARYRDSFRLALGTFLHEVGGASA